MASDAKMASERSDAVRPMKLMGPGDDKSAALVRIFCSGARNTARLFLIVYFSQRCN